MAVPPLTTPRLALRELTADDAPFLVALLNEPAFLRHIGDRQVRTPADACAYLAKGPAASYARHHLGLLHVGLRTTGDSLGICGLLRRDELPHPDIGFAFLERHWGRGYATESATAVLAEGCARLGLDRVLGITSLDNTASMHVLEKLGLRFEHLLETPGLAPRRLFGTPPGWAAPAA